MCCPAGEHVNTEGEKNFLQAKAFPPSRTPSTRRLHMQGRRKGGGGGGGGGMKRMGRRGMKTAERWKKVLNGKKKRGEKVSGQKKK